MRLRQERSVAYPDRRRCAVLGHDTDIASQRSRPGRYPTFADTHRHQSASAETLPGSAMGTPAYMRPEQAKGEIDQLGPRSDVYSLGATLYCLLTGRPPFQSEDLHSLLLAARNGEFPPPRQLDPTIDTTVFELRLRRAAALAPFGDHHAALTSVADAERAKPDRAKLNLAMRFAAWHAEVLGAISRDSALSAAARAAGVAAQLEAALDFVGQAGRTLAYRDSRRLHRRPADREFDALRGQPAFQLLMMDLSFPAQPFAGPE